MKPFVPAGPAIAAALAIQAGIAFVQAETNFAPHLEGALPRCGTPDILTMELLYGRVLLDPSDCSAGSTNPLPVYDPGSTYEIPVVVHILMDNSCSQGAIADELVHSQIEILNEDFLALPGSNGENGVDMQVRFVLAAEDPDGNPTDGITRSCNTTWFNDGGSYWNSLAWDPHRYLNIYTNTAGGNLGYVPFLPANNPGGIGTPADRVVVHWASFGRDAPGWPNQYDQGRTATHEVGHYLGLYHTFQGGGSCPSGTPPACYSNGDRICDTETQQNPNFGCPAASSCGSPDPIDNYMNYTDDLCMQRFTLEQSRRMRCTLEGYRPNVFSIVGGDPEIEIDPEALSSALLEGDSEILELSISNNGSSSLAWSIYDGSTANPGACDTPDDISWLSVDPMDGITVPAADAVVELLFDAGALTGDHFLEAALCIESDDPINPLVVVDVDLTVERPAELTIDPEAFDFESVEAGTVASTLFSVRNAAEAGARSLDLTDITVAGDASFAASGNGSCAPGLMLQPEAKCTVEVVFSPPEAGEFSGLLEVQGDDGAGGQTVTAGLSGTGFERDPGELAVEPLELDFGAVATGGSSELEVTISNAAASGAEILELADISIVIGEAFAVDVGDCGETLAPQQSCAIEIHFTPDAEAAYSGLLRVVAGGETVNVSLSGNGAEPVPGIFEDRFEQ